MNFMAQGGDDATPSWVRETRKTPPPADRVRVLVVDDMSSMRSVMGGILRGLGYSKVQESDSGEEALRRLTAGGVDLLITDWNMPGMNGVQLIEQARQSERFGRLPILMVSADAGREDIAAAAGHGVDGFIVKPFTPTLLSEKLSEILLRKRDVLELLWAGQPTGTGAPKAAVRASPTPATPATPAKPVTRAAPAVPQNVPDTATATDAAAPKRFKLSSI